MVIMNDNKKEGSKMASINEMEKKAVKISADNAYRKRLAQALHPDPSEWKFTGIVTEAQGLITSKCACGHSIKFEFHIERKRDGLKAIVGSTCINHYADINPELVEAIDGAYKKLQAEIRKAKKKSKKAKQQKEVDNLKAIYEYIYKRGYSIYLAYRDRDQKAPRALWEAYGSHYYHLPYPASDPKYKTARGYKNYYKKAINDARRSLENSGINPDTI